MWEVLVDIAKWFIPPKIDAAAEHQYWWRVRVGVVTCMAFSGVCFITAASYGLIPKVDGFVRSSELASYVQGINNNLDGLRQQEMASTIDRLKAEMLNINQLHCKLPSGDARTIYANQITAMQSKYEELTKGPPFPVPACSDL
jgi:hypothetical protein